MMKSSLAIVFMLVVLVVFTQGRALNDQKVVSYTYRKFLFNVERNTLIREFNIKKVKVTEHDRLHMFEVLYN
jgi:hypothetical protein